MSDEFHPFSSKESRDRFIAHLDSLEKLWPIQHESRMVHTRYGETFARIGGPSDASPMVLLPGGQSSSLVWRRLICPLSDRFRTYALDAIKIATNSKLMTGILFYFLFRLFLLLISDNYSSLFLFFYFFTLFYLLILRVLFKMHRYASL
jgi:hypothetical protein